MMFSSAFVILGLAAQLVHSHGVLVAVAGANGVTGQGFGVDASTPRDGSTPRPFEQDTSIIRDNEIQRGKADACGRTKEGGNNDIATQLQAAVASGLPSVAADGTVSMTLHQVNADGAGPYTCGVSTDASGASFADMTVTTNVPGLFSLSPAQATDFPLVAKMPAGATCTGGPNGDACIVRCRNSALAGPFGGCAAVTNAGATGNATAATAAGAGTVADTAAAVGTAAAVETAAVVGAAPAAVGTAAAADSVVATGAPATVATPVAAAGVAQANANGAAGTKNTAKRVLKSRIIGKALAGRWI